MFGRNYIIFFDPQNYPTLPNPFRNKGYLSLMPGGQEGTAPDSRLARQFNGLTAGLKAWWLERQYPGVTARPICTRGFTY